MTPTEREGAQLPTNIYSVEFGKYWADRIDADAAALSEQLCIVREAGKAVNDLVEAYKEEKREK